MGPISLESPPESPPRSGSHSTSTRRPYPPPKKSKPLRWWALGFACLCAGIFAFGLGSWPYRDGIREAWQGAMGGSMGGLREWADGSGGYPSQEDVSTTAAGLEDASLQYRRRLERETSPSGFLSHHPTLGFSHIYVLSLPHREDRRATMRQLAAALGVNMTFVNGTPKDESVIGWIGERASEIRRKKRKAMAEWMNVSEGTVGGYGVGSVWLTRSTGGEGNQGPLRDIEFPSLSRDDYGGRDWVQHLWETDPAALKPDDPNFNVTAAMWDPLERISERQVSPATISTYYNHLRVLRLMKERGDESALVLEDDVDVEWDLERRWRLIERRLPTNWETVFLGHCWGREIFEPQYLHPNLHKSTAPLCLHGYAVSKRGYTRLLDLYSDPWLSFQTPVDTCVPTWIAAGLGSFSVEPQVIIQAKADRSDIQLGKGSTWKGLLADSTLERVRRFEGEPIDPPSPDDPATLYRYRKPATIPTLDAPFLKCSGGSIPGTKGHRHVP